MSQITKRALEQSLKNLLREKPLSKITVTDITEDCGISRMTFYYHFKDIYDLVRTLPRHWPTKRPTIPGSRALFKSSTRCGKIRSL